MGVPQQIRVVVALLRQPRNLAATPALRTELETVASHYGRSPRSVDWPKGVGGTCTRRWARFPRLLSANRPGRACCRLGRHRQQPQRRSLLHIECDWFIVLCSNLLYSLISLFLCRYI